MNQRPSSPTTAPRPRPSSTVAPPAAADTVLMEETPTVQVGSASHHAPSPHDIEYEVQRRLQTHPALKFSRLHVHQCREGICLEGFLESNEYEIDLCEVVRGIAGVTGVLNRVVLSRPGSTVPKKG